MAADKPLPRGAPTPADRRRLAAKRMTARAVDLAIAGVLVLLYWLHVPGGALWLIAATLYLTFGDALLRSGSVGKRIVGLQVVQLRRRRHASWRGSAIRNGPGAVVLLLLLIHGALGIVLFAVVPSPFGQPRQQPLGEVITVTLIGGPEIVTPAAAEPEPIAEEPPPDLTVPQPAEDIPEEIPLSDPTTADEAELEPAPEPKPEQRHPTNTATAESSGDSEIHAPPTQGNSPFAGATIDNASFQYPYWFTQAFNQILRSWHNPVASNSPLICVIYFQVIKSGRMIEARVETSSGIDSFDDACLRAVNSAAPFPPLPRRFADEIIGLTLPFKYEPSR